MKKRKKYTWIFFYFSLLYCCIPIHFIQIASCIEFPKTKNRAKLYYGCIRDRKKGDIWMGTSIYWIEQEKKNSRWNLMNCIFGLLHSLIYFTSTMLTISLNKLLKTWILYFNFCEETWFFLFLGEFLKFCQKFIQNFILKIKKNT